MLRIRTGRYLPVINGSVHCSVNYYAPTCISDMLNGCHLHQFVTSASLRCRRFVQYAFRSNIITMHQNFGWYISVKWALKKYVQKLCKSQETALPLFCLLDWSSAMKCKTVGSHDKPQLAQYTLRNLMWLFESSWLPPGRMENKFPMLTLTPWISKHDLLIITGVMEWFPVPNPRSDSVIWLSRNSVVFMTKQELTYDTQFHLQFGLLHCVPIATDWIIWLSLTVNRDFNETPTQLCCIQ